uniref:Uncharacterized protein n=1 Tax=Clytia hemisphaerica TaxID=252671 RepID=A0A7M5WYH1_9CNID
MDKFNRDRLQNQFAGSVFWSKTSKIPETTDTGPRKSGQNYLWIDPQSKCLYVRGEQMERIAHIVFIYIDFLKVLNQQGGEATVLGNNIQIMFGMMSSRYKAFCKLRKEFEKVDKTFTNNLDIVKEMCQPRKPNISPMKRGNSSTEIGYASDSKPSPLKKTKSSPQPRSNVAPAINNLTAVSGGSEI